ncbi:MAG: MerR family transcriptional regulator [Desulfotomaculaceae bacterium]|nr:MerR family transcriptional regulator [Desulfotomaculaceae bacterium]
MKEAEPKKNLLKISEVVKAARVSAQTVHFYLREGLLTPPVKTAPNMAYYYPVIIDEIKLIKELQTKRYLPISVIKIILEARRGGQKADHIEEMQSVLVQLFKNPDTETPGELASTKDFISSTGLSETTIGLLEEMGLLTPTCEVDGKCYGKADGRIGRMFKKLLDLGLTLEDLRMYSQYAQMLRLEARTMRGKLIHRVHDGSVSLKEIVDLLNDLKTELAEKIYREAVSGPRP